MTPAALPEGEIPSITGELPEHAGQNAEQRSFSAYVHIPFCVTRCGYCDFNTYVASEVDSDAQSGYAASVLAEIEQSQRLMLQAAVPQRALNTVFFGGGTPTLLPAAEIGRIIESLSDSFGLEPGAEITIEANPDTVDAYVLRELHDRGVTRISFGVQSAVSHVLSTLDRTHDPERVPEVVRAAQQEGLQVSIDLIYGTPGESLADWNKSVNYALDLKVDHVSAYALTIEQGTAMHRKIERGDIAPIDEDTQAEMYLLADNAFTAAGLNWYEVSNWARSEKHMSQHNLNYWLDNDWWGYGPGAHGHLGAMRQWNVKHPREYARRLSRGESPAAGRETLDEETQELEKLLLHSRLRKGFDVSGFDPLRVTELVARGLISLDADHQAIAGSAVAVLTQTGRLRADEVVRLLSWDERSRNPIA